MTSGVVCSSGIWKGCQTICNYSNNICIDFCPVSQVTLRATAVCVGGCVNVWNCIFVCFLIGSCWSLCLWQLLRVLLNVSTPRAKCSCIQNTNNTNRINRNIMYCTQGYFSLPASLIVYNLPLSFTPCPVFLVNNLFQQNWTKIHDGPVT